MEKAVMSELLGFHIYYCDMPIHSEAATCEDSRRKYFAFFCISFHLRTSKT
jgi:hypothetical protein